MPQKSSSAKWWLLGCGGCLGLTLLGLLAFGGMFWGIFSTVSGVIKNTEVYASSLSKAQASPAVQEALGTPIEEGFMFQGSINVDGNSGNADFSVPLKGPKGEAKLVVTARRASANPWQYSVQEVRLPDGRVIDLRTP